MFYVISDGLYHTGQFSRDVPPAAYLGCKEDAASWETREQAQAWVDEFGGKIIEDFPTITAYEELVSKYALANMHLATLCDIVLGEDAADRSDEALILATATLKHKYLYLHNVLEEVKAIGSIPIDASDAMDELDHLLQGIEQDKC